MEDHTIEAIVLPPNSKLNAHIIEQLDQLFQYVPPNQIRDTIIELYNMYILHEHKELPEDFHTTAENAYLLIEFLKIAGER